MTVPVDEAEYLARYAKVERYLDDSTGATRTVMMKEMLELAEFLRLNPVSGSMHADNWHGGFAWIPDAATAITPLTVLSGVPLAFENDGAGLDPSDQLPDGITSVWNPVTDSFDWSELKVNDLVDMRVDFTVTSTAPNQGGSFYMDIAEGTANEYRVVFATNEMKVAGTYRVNRTNGFYIGSQNVIDTPSKLMIESDGNATVIVHGFFVKVTRKGPVM